MPSSVRLRLGIMLISWAFLHRGHCFKSCPTWRRSNLNRFASSSSPDENKDDKSSTNSPSEGTNQESRSSKYYNEIFKTVGKPATTNNPRQVKTSPFMPNLDTVDVYDLYLSAESSSYNTADESLHSNIEDPWIDERSQKGKRDERGSRDMNGQYQSLTHHLMTAGNSLGRAIPPSTLEYDYSQDQDSLQPRNPPPKTSRSMNTLYSNKSSSVPIRNKSNNNIQQVTTNTKRKSTNTNSIESTDRNTQSIPYKNQNTFGINNPTQMKTDNVPVLDPIAKSRMNPFLDSTESQDPFTRYPETLQPFSSKTNIDAYLSDASSTTLPEQDAPLESHMDTLKNRLRILELDMFVLNNNKTFNLNSRREISTILYGVDNESINKDTLDALAGSNRVPANRIAGLLLSHRKLSRQLKTLGKDVQVTEWGVKAKRLSPETLEDSVSSSEDVDDTFSITGESSTTPSFFQDSDPLMLVDASAYIFRAYYSMPPIHRFDGMPVGAVLGFCNMVNNLVLDAYIKGERPRLALIFDSKEGVSIRKTLYPQYKANRPPCPVDLIPQFDLIKAAADAYGILKIEAPGHEADDVIATLANIAQREGCKVNIYSADKDLMQLITKDGGITMVDPMKLTSISYDVVVEKWNVPPEKLGSVLALAGDSSDNIPGVPGIGPKTAASLINEYGSLDALLSNLDSIKQKGRRENLIKNIDSVAISRQLVKLETAIPTKNMTLPDNFSINDLRMETRSPSNEERLLQFYSDMGLRDIARRVKGRFYQDSLPTATTTATTTIASTTRLNHFDSNQTIEKNPSTDPTSHFKADSSQTMEKPPTADPTFPFKAENESTTGIDNRSLRNISFISPRPKPPPDPMEYDDVPF